MYYPPLKGGAMGKILTSTEIGWKLRTIRHKSGLSQEQLAEQVGVTPQQIQKYESGQSKLNSDRLQQIAHALSVPVQSFFTDGNESLPPDLTEKALLHAFRAIPNKEIQECILKITTVASKPS
jgi:transcriptional regulator with XRE-family HTH domain